MRSECMSAFNDFQECKLSAELILNTIEWYRIILNNLVSSWIILNNIQQDWTVLTSIE